LKPFFPAETFELLPELSDFFDRASKAGWLWAYEVQILARVVGGHAWESWTPEGLEKTSQDLARLMGDRALLADTCASMSEFVDRVRNNLHNHAFFRMAMKQAKELFFGWLTHYSLSGDRVQEVFAGYLLRLQFALCALLAYYNGPLQPFQVKTSVAFSPSLF
jgi:hypothetical protein